MRSVSIRLAAAWLVVLASGCASMPKVDWTGSELAFKDAYKTYTRSLRWGEIERASAAVDPERRDAFLAGMRDLGEMHFTDYEIDETEFDSLAQTATVRVRYRAFRTDTLEDNTYLETQHWSRDAETGVWRVDHEGPPLVPARSVGAR
ncbi:hypothetical protein MYXO_03524 [Myxococcaceae bacterium]|jgi:hypothetical protein|nr:hypothetical protein MYXO_03524 [Myxococcaceae bacterium]